MAISAKDVSELRKSTGAGMMDCKKALEESGGDMGRCLGVPSQERSKGCRRNGLTAKQMKVSSSPWLMEAKGSSWHSAAKPTSLPRTKNFIALAESIAKAAMEKGLSTKEEVAAMDLDGTTVAEKLVERTGTIGEKIEVAEFQTIEGDQMASYIHAGSKIGVLVSYKDGGKDDASQFFRGVAMHIAAMSPSILTPDEFDAEFVQKETEALQGQIKSRTKIANGWENRLRMFPNSLAENN